ncbi:MAG: DUF4382 domain-containing protein [Bacillota bacterium]
MLKRSLRIAALAPVCLLLASCGGSHNSGLNLFMTDAPIDSASAVNVSFAALQLTGPDVTPQTLAINPPSSIDLFQLQGGIAAVLTSNLQIAPGHYTQLSLTIAADPNTDQSDITLPDGTHILYVPVGTSPTVSTPIDFTIASGGTVNLTIDFDLRRSIIQDPNDATKYELIPSIRAVQNELSGTLSGSVASSLIICAEPAVYIYAGKVIPGDVDIDPATASKTAAQPITTALAGFNQTTSLYNFTASFLPPGTYTLAFTCDAPLDVANQANTLTFTSITTAVVSARNTTFVQMQ